jgi:hypothetical protein
MPQGGVTDQELREKGTGVMGNNRAPAVISNQIAIMMCAAIESIARHEIEDVDERDCDMSSGVHNRGEQRQARAGRKFSSLNTFDREHPSRC